MSFEEAPLPPFAIEDVRSLHRRIAAKLGVDSLGSDDDLEILVERRLPVDSLRALAGQGVEEAEIFALILPRRTLSHRRAKGEPLSREESDRAVRLARLVALAEEVFGDEAKAARWLRRPKRRFDGRTPMDLLATEAGARLVEEMLYQIDYGMAA